MTDNGIYTRKMIVSPDYCDQDTSLSPVAVFTIMQAVSAEHAQILGIGASDMIKSGKFWVAVHNRVDYYSRAWLLDEITVSTWAEPSDPESFRCFRGYSVEKNGKCIAMARTQWAILDQKGKALPFKDSGFPEDFQYPDIKGITDEPAWLDDKFTAEELIREQKVLSTDIDFGRHMNNVAYVRRFLDHFPAAKQTAASLASIEIHYGTPCRENETIRLYGSMEENNAFRMAFKNEQEKTAASARIRFRE